MKKTENNTQHVGSTDRAIADKREVRRRVGEL